MKRVCFLCLILAYLVATGIHFPVLSQEIEKSEPTTQDPQQDPEVLPPLEEKKSEAYRLLGPPLSPFYDHYIRTSDQTEVLNILYLYQSSRSPLGNASNLLFPFYFWRYAPEPEDWRLYLFPFLFFHRKSAEASFNISFPLYYDYRTKAESYQFLFPLWLRHRNVEKASLKNHFLFPLSRFRSEQINATERVSAFRFGIPKFLELFETYKSSSKESRIAALSLFNFNEEAQSRFGLFHSSRTKSNSDNEKSWTHFFPFFWQGSNNERNHLYFLPLYFQGGSVQGEYLWALPFYGHTLGEGKRDLYFPALLSHIGESDDGEVRRDFLWPLYQRKYGPKNSSFHSFPLFGYSWSPEIRKWNFLYFLYENEYHPRSEKSAHSVIWPLGRFDVEPDGVTGHRRFIPLYYDDFDEDRRLRFSPLFFNYQWRSGKIVDYDFTFAWPDYIGWGSLDDYFRFAFPLYWGSRSGRSGWDLFLPIYFSFFRSASFGVHVLPIFSYNSFPSEKQFIIGGPLFVHRRFRDFEDNPDGTSTSILWPLTEVENRPNGYHYRFLPLFWVSKKNDTRDFLLFPFWYRQWGGNKDHNYFFAAYGRYQTDRLTRDFYGLGSYIHTREKNDEGKVFRDRKDILWSALSVQKNEETHETHQHILPFGFWKTRSVAEDRTILGPLYYHHRIEGEERKTHLLNMVLGNIWFSRKTTQQGLESPTSPTEEPKHVTETISSDKGAVWPLVRWGFDKKNDMKRRWVLPLYVHRESLNGETNVLFPLVFLDHSYAKYQPSYFRYFFLFDYEHWETGYRVSIAQLLADYMTDEEKDEQRWRFFYPMTEYMRNKNGYSYQITPLIQGKDQIQGGQKEVSHFLFPLYWSGSTQKKTGEYTFDIENEHLFIFPIYGYNHKSLRTQREYLIPFFHTEHGINSFKFQFRPFFFWRKDPEEFSIRTWPIHSFERGEASGDWWVSKYLYFSKNFVRNERWSYRLDPFLFRINSGRGSFGVSGLFELFAYDRKGSGMRSETSYRALPFIYGHSRQKEAVFLSFPFYYEQDHGIQSIDYLNPWRYLFITNHLRGGNGDRHTSLLWKLMEYRDNPNRPEFHEFRILYALYQDIQDVSFRQNAVQPFFYYSRDQTDPFREETNLFILPLLGYRHHKVAERSRHYLFWFIPIWWN